MSASEHIEVRRTFRGNVARVGGALAGLFLAWSVQPFAADAHDNANVHFGLYSHYLRESGITWGMDFDVQPGDQALIDRAHAEEQSGSNWQYIRLAEEGGAVLLLAGGIAVGLLAARREETAAAIWTTATRTTPSGE